jgi:hypothetical protein
MQEGICMKTLLTLIAETESVQKGSPRIMLEPPRPRELNAVSIAASEGLIQKLEEEIEELSLRKYEASQLYLLKSRKVE